MSTNENIAKLQAEIKEVEDNLLHKGLQCKKLMDEWLDLCLRKEYLIACLEDAQSTVTTETKKTNKKGKY